MFKINIISCLILLVSLLRITRGSTLTIGELTAQHSEDTVRQTKSEQIQRYMNESVDPCEDFYEFTCGNFARYNPTNAENERVVNMMEIMDKEMTQKIKNALETWDATDTDMDRKVKAFYKSCLNAPQLMNVYGDKLREIIEEIGTMPAVAGEQWQKSNFDWVEILARMINKSGVKIIFEIDIEEDLADNTINRLVIGDPTLLLKDRSFYVDEAVSYHLERLVQSIAGNLKTFLGVEEGLAQQVAIEIKDFEVALAKGITDEKLGLKINEIYTLTDIDNLQRQYKEFLDIKSLLDDALGLAPQKLYVNNQYVETALKAVQNTPSRVVANYLFYSYILNFITTISDSRSDMEEACMYTTKENFYKKLDNMMYHKYFTEQMEEQVYRMWREMKITFRNILQSPRLEWIRQETRSEALAKLKTMKMIINSYEDYNFTHDFDQLNFNDFDYVHNMKSILMMRGNKVSAKMHQPPEPVDLGSESSFTPVYSPGDNAVKLPLGFLQPFYLWSTSYPYAYNFASLGSFVAHELVHGFDDSGRHFDQKGNNRDWWDTESADSFVDRTTCFVEQYKRYIYGGVPLPESPLQAENIADNGGVRLAYEAYLNWYGKAVRTNQNLNLESFPDLNFTHKQLFFISYSHAWCSAVDQDYMAIQMATDIHVPEKYRVIGSLANFDEFSKAFKCPKGTGMNPVNKCVIY